MRRPGLIALLLLSRSWLRLWVIGWGAAMVPLLLFSYGPRRGESFVLCRGFHANPREGNFASRGIHRLITSKGRRPLGDRTGALTWRRSQGTELRMDARSCAPEITDETFEAEVLLQSTRQPVLVFFRAPWCGPCRMVGPIVDEVIDEHGAKLKVLEICTDENPETVAKFKIRNIPTLMLFSDRKSVMTVVGAVPKSALVSSIKKHMDL